ncbi:MAG: hypothetical protein H0W73_08305 [Bacteroidetes bacterium]|nr:hypothetical protein [Bacteroidota bacterium]
MLAGIPLLFAMQQFAEGFVWLSLSGNENYLSAQLSTNLFLTFALIIWPLWVPLAMLFIEKNNKRRKMLGAISCMGLLFSIFAIYYLCIKDHGARIAHYHIHYDLEVSNRILLIAGTLYLIPTVGSHFFSSIKLVPFMGFIVLISHIVTRLFFKDNLLSVWCFFAAVISITIYFILTRKAIVNDKLSEETEKLPAINVIPSLINYN